APSPGLGSARRSRPPRARTRGPSRGRPRRSPTSSVVPELEHGQERLLWHLDPPDLLHPALALLLLLQQLALTAGVTRGALGVDVLAERLDGLAGDDLGADGGLDRHVVLLARDLLPQPLGEHLALVVGLVTMDDHAQRVDRVAAEQDVELDEVRGAQPDRLVVERAGAE